MSNLANTGERQHSEVFDINALEHLHRYAFAEQLCRDSDVLDIASGEGYGSNILSVNAKSVVGVDISEQAVFHASQKYIRNNLRYLVGSADAIPLPDHSVDRVVSFETLEHHTKHKEMLAEIRRVLRPNGILVISTPDKLHYTDEPQQYNEFHVKELYLEEFRDLMRPYFAHCQMYYQRTGYYGVIVPERPGNYGFNHYQGDFNGAIADQTVPKSIYNICLASDVGLPEPGFSVYSGNLIYENLSSLGHDNETELARLRVAFSNANNEMSNLRASMSYRVGSMITWPLRLMRDLAKK